MCFSRYCNMINKRDNVRATLCPRNHCCCGKEVTNSMQQNLLEKLTDPQLLKKVPVFYGTRTFITAFRRAHCLLWKSWKSYIFVCVWGWVAGGGGCTNAGVCLCTCSLRPWLHWSQNRHNTTVWTDCREGSNLNWPARYLQTNSQ
jgi:hypothetical protein